ncbi:MAG TPA: hypothetical protein VFN97_02945 [Actinospica sp.]|nr:hypothetical protein [Actinospica sp.]
MLDETFTGPADERQEDVEPLSKWERLGANAAGVICLGAGVVSVFTTSNQAGSVALLGVGAVFLTVAVNGAPLLGGRLKESHVGTDVRRRTVAEQATQAGPEEGQRKLDILEQLDPASREDPVVIDAHVRLYRREVAAALVRAVAKSDATNVQVLEHVPHKPDRTDMQVQAPALILDIELVYARGDWMLSDHALRQTFQSASRSGVPRILITNMRIPNTVTDIADVYDPEHTRVQVVRWRDVQDETALELALHRLGIRMPRFTAW